ncbi:hypothetical protein HDV06_001485 [Boothiomyces sp. JEL0866]|nr:hypothetical protein HDV06_001485 [Boothiomyces sp. JEL0866]
MNFNQDQQFVIKNLEEFLEQDEYKSVLLDAAGGTGKSFTIKYFNNKAIYLTPTHQAKKVLVAEKLCNVYTIARFLRMEMDYDENGKETPIFKGVDEKLLITNSKPFIIIDECSMLTTEQVKALENVDYHKLYCGDKCQLPPIEKVENSNENIEKSVVYDLEFFKKLTLTKNMRCGDNPISLVNNYFRNIILNIKNVKKPIIETVNKDQVLELFVKNRDLNHNSKEDIRVVSYTNAKVNYWNNEIRQRLYPNQFKDKFVLGEKLIVDKYIHQSKLYTGDDFVVEEIQRIRKIYKKYLCRCENCKRYVAKKYDGLDYISVEIETFEIKYDGKTYYKPVDEINEKLIKNILMTEKCKIKNQDCNSNTRKELWKELYSWYSSNNVPLIYTYSITIHKSQGSGFSTVIFDTHGLHYNDLSRKLRYVAVSRAKKSLFQICR